LDLPSHLAFGLAVGFVFFGKPEIALLIGLGALVPDLDREYWYVREKKYAEEQYHRARFHNVFLIAVAYLVNPYFSMGVFLHMLQDSFTTAKDRGLEWFYPMTRLVKRGMYDQNMKQEKLDPKEHVYFYQEDPLGYVNAADTDLREGAEPVPWRRVYGFAQNSHLLDRGFMFGSAAIIVIWLSYPLGFVHFQQLLDFIKSTGAIWPIGYVSLIVLFAAGETQRRDKIPKIPQLKPIQFPLLIFGVILLVLWGILFRSEIFSNLESIFADPFPLIAGVVVVPLVAIVLIRYYTRGGRNAIV